MSNDDLTTKLSFTTGLCINWHSIGLDYENAVSNPKHLHVTEARNYIANFGEDLLATKSKLNPFYT